MNLEKESVDFALFVLAVFAGGVLIGCLAATNAITRFRDKQILSPRRPDKKYSKPDKTNPDNAFDN